MMTTRTAGAGFADSVLFESWVERRSEQPQLDNRQCALDLGVSEAQLVAARCAQGEGRSLRAAPAPLLAAIPALGTVTGQTFSDAAVIENTGTYGPPDIGEHTGIVIGDNIDLRIFPSGWASAYALTDRVDGVTQRSIQIFAVDGTATHKIQLSPAGNVAAYDALVQSLALPEVVSPGSSSVVSDAEITRDDAVDLAAYRTAFAGMQDTHDFFMLLRRFKLMREQGLRLAGSDYARVLAPHAHRELFERAADGKIPLMIFVANSGMVQIASGCVPRPSFTGARMNLIDPAFRFELHEADVARAWFVRKPTVNGVVSSLELYTDHGELIAQVFGERHAGEMERADWATAISTLPV